MPYKLKFTLFYPFYKQEIFHEHSTHLRLLAKLEATHNFPGATQSSSATITFKQHQPLTASTSLIPDRLQSNTLLSYRTGARHGPYFVYGAHGTGKSGAIAEIYRNCTEWFEHVRVHRILRFAAATPRSAYNLELLRVICQQISIVFNIPEGYLPKDASFDPLYINNWFQNLIKRCEDMQNDVLFLFIDDLHRLNPLDCDIVAALSWLPISLPWNVYLVFSIAVPVESLRLTPMQKERFKSGECLYPLATDLFPASHSFDQYISGMFDRLETRFGEKGIARLATYVTCTQYGLTETELLELLMPIHNSEASIESADGYFNFSSFRCVLNAMGKLGECIIYFSKWQIVLFWQNRCSVKN